MLCPVCKEPIRNNASKFCCMCGFDLQNQASPIGYAEPQQLSMQISIDCSPIKEIETNLERLVELLEEANILVDNLASRKIELKVNI